MGVVQEALQIPPLQAAADSDQQRAVLPNMANQ